VEGEGEGGVCLGVNGRKGAGPYSGLSKRGGGYFELPCAKRRRETFQAARERGGVIRGREKSTGRRKAPSKKQDLLCRRGKGGGVSRKKKRGEGGEGKVTPG